MNLSASNTASDPLRKAAVLLTVLDIDTADMLLEQMSGEQSALIRQRLLSLGEVSAEEQDAVVAEFFQAGGFFASDDSPAAELDPALARRLAAEAEDAVGAPDVAPTATAPPTARPFACLAEASDDDLAAFLEAENPQTSALVVSHLTPNRAAAVLAIVSAGRQAEIVRRLVELEQTDGEVVRLVERGVEERLREIAHERRRREISLAAVASMLTAAKGPAGERLIENVAQEAPQLAAHLPKLPAPSAAEPAPAVQRMSYPELLQLSGTSLLQVLAEAEAEVVVLALAGSTPAQTDRALRLFDPHDARLLRQAMERLGPTRLSDVEQAQQELVEIALRLEERGELELPFRQHFAAVA